MRGHGVWSRLFAGIMVGWFGLVMAAPALLHTCPQAMSASTMATSGAEQAQHAHHHSGQQDPGAPVRCQCLGSCAISTPAVLPGSATVPVAVVTPHAPAVLSAANRTVAVLQVPHAQPFATAPPLRLG